MVRLITQHLLACPVKTCSYPSNFPLSFQNVETIQVVEAEFNEEFMRGFVGRLEWDALRKSAAEVSARRREEGGQLARSWGRSTECELTCLSCTQLGNTDLPGASPDLSQPQDIPIELLHVLHHVLLEVRSSSPIRLLSPSLHPPLYSVPLLPEVYRRTEVQEAAEHELTSFLSQIQVQDRKSVV